MKSSKDGFQFTCKSCQKIVRRKRLNVSNFTRDLHKDNTGRVCGSCKTYKLYSEYYKASGSDSYRSVCKVCFSNKTKARRKIDSDRMKEISRKSYEKCKHRYKEREKRYYQENKETYKARQERYMTCPNYRKNKREKHRIWELSNWDKRLEQKRKNRKTRSQVDEVYVLQGKTRCRLYSILKNKAVRKNQNTIDYLGLTWEPLWNYLCSKFEESYGMPRSWLTSLDYEIDHIIPLSLASSEEDIKTLAHYTNLQILLKEDNRNKSHLIGWDVMESSIC